MIEGLRIKRLLAAGLWIGAAALAIATFQSRASAPEPPLFPDPGSRLSVRAIEKTFMLDGLTSDRSWLFLVTTDCEACLSLDAELDSLKKAANCAEARLVPLVILTRLGVDSIRNVLGSHGLRVEGMAGDEGFTVLDVRSVPVVIALDRQGTVTAVKHPLRPPWPPRGECSLGERPAGD